MSNGLDIRRSRDREVTGPQPVWNCLLRQSRLAEMTGDELRLRFDKLRKAGFDRHGDPRVQLLAAALEQALVGGVTHQRVLEHIGGGRRKAPPASTLRTTCDEIARTAGLGRDAVQRRDRIQSDKTQRRLREMVEIINKVEPRLGSTLMAYAWYRSEPLPGFSGLTAMRLVCDGKADDVLKYIDAVDAGSHV